MTEGSHVLRHVVLSLTFLLLAACGWGAFAYTLQAQQQQEKGLQDQLSRITAERDHLAAQATQLQAAHDRQRDLDRQVNEARAERDAARREVRTLTQALSQARTEAASARAQVTLLTLQVEEWKTKEQAAREAAAKPAPRSRARPR